MIKFIFAVFAALTMGAASYAAIELLIGLMKMPEWGWYQYAASGVIGFFTAVSYLQANKYGPIDNWKTWAMVANNKAVITLSLIFSITPFVVKSGVVMGLEENIPFILYLYWVCGLSFFLFIILFNLTAHQIYKHQSFKSFLESEGSIYSLRNLATEVANDMEKRQKKDKIKDFEKAYFSEDLNKVNFISNSQFSDINDGEVSDYYYVLKERAKFTSGTSRFFVGLSVLLPAYILPTIIVLNIFTVGNMAVEHVESKGSIYKAMFDESSKP